MIRKTSRPAILPASLVALRCESLKYAGTVMTACVIFSPSFASASAFIFDKIIALTVHFHLDVCIAIRSLHNFVGNAMLFFVNFVELAAHEALDRENCVL